MTQFKVGDKVWTFNENRRVYDGSGSFGGKIIYAEHFVEREITDETPRSWIVNGKKYSKKDPSGLYTDQQKADDIWFHDNRWKIAKLVDRCMDIEKMRQIAAIVGYVEETK